MKGTEYNTTFETPLTINPIDKSFHNSIERSGFSREYPSMVRECFQIFSVQITGKCFSETPPPFDMIRSLVLHAEQPPIILTKSLSSHQVSNKCKSCK